MKHLILGPVVFLAGEHYDIVWTTYEKGAAWVEVGGKKYYDTITGIVRSDDTVHEVSVPQSELDKARKYEVSFLQVFERKAYFPITAEVAESKKYDFCPVPENPNIYVVGDAHGCVDTAAETGMFYGDKLNLLVLNGDVADNNTVEQLGEVVDLAHRITFGELPVVYVRGNHDIRGAASVMLNRYAGTDNGQFYFDFTAGNVYGIVLDCGEDKVDSHKEYGGLCAFDEYRKQQIKFLDEILDKKKYLDFDRILVFCHIEPQAEGNINMSDIYLQWIKRLNILKPDIMICAHEHIIKYFPPKSTFFGKGEIGFPVFVGSIFDEEWKRDICVLNDFAGTAVNFENDGLHLRVTGPEKNVIEQKTVQYASINVFNKAYYN